MTLRPYGLRPHSHYQGRDAVDRAGRSLPGRAGAPASAALANLHGEPTPLQALAKLTVQWDVLHGEMEELLAEVGQANNDETASITERDKADRHRLQLLERIVQVEKLLATVGKDGAAIEQLHRYAG